MPGRRPRTEIIAPVDRKKQDNEFELSIPELVHVLRLRSGYASHQALSDAARRYLPEWVTMNRRLIQQIERGDIPPEEVNDLYLVAIAAACKADPAKVFGIKKGESPDLDPLVDLLNRYFDWSSDCAGQHGCCTDAGSTSDFPWHAIRTVDPFLHSN